LKYIARSAIIFCPLVHWTLVEKSWAGLSPTPRVSRGETVQREPGATSMRPVAVLPSPFM
jgi:hypothetical protein